MNKQELRNLWLLLKDISKREKHTLSIIVIVAIVDAINSFISVLGMGHLVDLPKSQIGIDLENNFEPRYITIRGKGELLSKLKMDSSSISERIKDFLS